MEVLIIGAGTTGLLLAQGLKQNGVTAMVFERETSDYFASRQREWGCSLHWGNESINRVLPPEKQARIKEVWCDNHFKGAGVDLPQFDSSTGRIIAEISGGGNMMRVSRTKMKNLFREDVDIKYGKTLVSVTRQADGSVAATFEDGTTATGSVLIGCDGAKSLVRQALVGEENAKSSTLDLSMFNFTSKFDVETAEAIRAQHPIMVISYHPKGVFLWWSIQDVPDPEKPETWLFQVMMSWQGSPKREDLQTQGERLAFYKSMAPLCAEPFRTFIEKVPGDISFKIDKLSVWTPNDWFSSDLAGLVTLAGDAAHPMAPYRGQGLNNGLDDAAKLTVLLTRAARGELSPSASLQEYEGEMIPRAQREVAISEQAATATHNWDILMQHPMFKMGFARAKAEAKA